MKILFDVKNQIITRTDRNKVIANSTDYLEAEVTFSDDWTGHDKTLCFKNGETEYNIQLVNNKIEQESHLNLGVGTWKVYVIGVKDDQKILTNSCNLPVNASGWIGTTGPTSRLYEELLVIIQSLHSEAASEAMVRSAVAKYIEDNFAELITDQIDIAFSDFEHEIEDARKNLIGYNYSVVGNNVRETAREIWGEIHSVISASVHKKTNFFNPKAATPGYKLNTLTGGTESAEGYCVSEFIDISGITDWTIYTGDSDNDGKETASHCVVVAAACGEVVGQHDFTVAYYDENLMLISIDTKTMPAAGGEYKDFFAYGGTTTVYENKNVLGVKYIRISYKEDNYSTHNTSPEWYNLSTTIHVGIGAKWSYHDFKFSDYGFVLYSTPSDDSEIWEAIDDLKRDTSAGDETLAGPTVVVNVPSERPVEVAQINLKAGQDLNGHLHPFKEGDSINRLKLTCESLTVSGVTITVDAEAGTITVNGICRESYEYIITDDLDNILTQGSYILKCGNGNYNPRYSSRAFGLRLYNKNNPGVNEIWDNGEGHNFSFYGVTNRLSLSLGEGCIYDNLVYMPMIATYLEYSRAGYKFFDCEPWAQSNICSFSNTPSYGIGMKLKHQNPAGELSYWFSGIPNSEKWYGYIDVFESKLYITHNYIASYNSQQLTDEWFSDRDMPGNAANFQYPSTGAAVIFKREEPVVIDLTMSGSHISALKLYEGENTFETAGDSVKIQYHKSVFATPSDMPSKTSDLINDSGYITKDVDNLTNYYLKSETYNQTEVNNLISGVVTDLDWKESVATYADIATTYPNPQDGWTVNVKDTNITYRYNGSDWVSISANAIPQATTLVDGLMTTTQVTKLNGIESGAKVNVQADWSQADNTQDDFIKNKPTLGTAAAKDSTSAVTQSSANLVESGAVYTELNNKVDKVAGKQLSTEDYTTTEKTKLSGISTNATKTEASTTNGNIKIDGTETLVYKSPFKVVDGMLCWVSNS